MLLKFLKWYYFLILSVDSFLNSSECRPNCSPSEPVTHFFLVNQVALEYIWDVKLAIAVVLGDFACWRSRSFICHKIKCSGESLRSACLKAFIYRVRIILEAILALL